MHVEQLVRCGGSVEWKTEHMLVMQVQVGVVDLHYCDTEYNSLADMLNCW